ncbi:unnamed protein product [Merluccius merluccius]
MRRACLVLLLQMASRSRDPAVLCLRILEHVACLLLMRPPSGVERSSDPASDPSQRRWGNGAKCVRAAGVQRCVVRLGTVG